MTRDIPPEAIQAAASGIHALQCCAAPCESLSEHDEAIDECKGLASVALEAAEQVWPHDPPKRDLASTTAAVTERAPRPEVLGYRARPRAFGFGPPEETV